MKVTTYETLYHEDHSAILKHKCGKRDSSIVPSLFFSHFFIFFYFFGTSPFFMAFLLLLLFLFIPHLGQCSNNDDHHTSIYLQLKIATQYLEQDMNASGCVSGYAMNQE